MNKKTTVLLLILSIPTFVLAESPSIADDVKQNTSNISNNNNRLSNLEKENFSEIKNRLKKIETEKKPAVKTFIKGGNNGVVSCDTFCIGGGNNWWNSPKGTCIAAKFKESSLPTTCNAVPGLPHELICACVSIP